MTTDTPTTPRLHRAAVQTATLVALAAVTAACGATTGATEELDAAAGEPVASETASATDDTIDDTTTRTTTPTLTLSPPDRPGCGFPFASEDGLHVFVNRDDRLLRYDLTTGEVVDHGPDEGDCPGWVGDPTTGRKVVSAGRIDGTWLGSLDGELDVRLDTDDELWVFSRAIVGNRVVLGSPDTASFHVVDATTGEFVAEVPAPDGDFGLTFGSDGTIIGLTRETTDGGEAILLDAATGAELHRVPLAAGAEESVFDLTTGELLVPTTDGKLVTIDIETGEVVSEVDRSIGGGVVAIGVRPDGMVVIATEELLEVVDRSAGPTGVAAPVEDARAMRVRPDGTVLRIGFGGEMEVVALEGSGPLLDVAPRG